MKVTALSVLFLLFSVSNAFFFYTAGSERKCFYKELNKGALLVGKYLVEVRDPETNLFKGADPTQLGVVIDVEEVFDDDHRVVHQKGAPRSEFSFSALETGDHRICFQAQSKGWLAKIQTKITIDFTLGDDEILDSRKKGKVESLSRKVKSLNNKVLNIRREQGLMREREAQFRDQSESTNSKVVNWAIYQLIALGVTCYWQTKHLRSFFVKQKIV